jgi:integrase
MNDAALLFVTPAALVAGGNPIINMERTFMARHTTMPPRIQHTPHGDVTLTSRWFRERYFLVAYGPNEALRWMFPQADGFEFFGDKARHTFVPAPGNVTVERDLRRIAAQWQNAWTARCEDEQAGHSQIPQVASPPSVVTLGQLVLRYHEVRQGELASRTLERNGHYMRNWSSVLGDSLPLAALTQDRLAAARQKLTADLAISTVNDAFGLLRTVLCWAVRQDYLAKDPADGMKPLRQIGGHVERPWWTVEGVSLALECARQVDCDMAGSNGTVGHTAELLVALGCLLGLRYEEIVMLRWEDIELDAVHQRTGQSEPVCRVRPHDGWGPKDGEARAIPVQTDLAKLLRQHRKAEGYILEPKRPMPRRGGKKHTYRYDPQAIWNRVNRKVEERGGKAINPHGMRHSFASNLLMAGVSDVMVARWLGHSDTSMIHERYGHLLAYHADIDRMKLT